MPAATVTKAPKATTTKKSTSKVTGPVAHPTWKDIISECVALHKEDARIGVSRQTIKKYASDKYKLEATPANISRLAQAITHGAEKGIFVLPKGPAGRVKLSPSGKAKADENTTPPPKAVKAAPVKVVKPTKVATTKKPAATKTKTKVAAPKTKKTASTAVAKKIAAAKASATKAPRKAPTARKAPAVRA